ncbi:MAG: hypothetical protein K5695_01550 [Oscillospiraceae bacterium]|nr:hypothetical protein [Oscillospiraceae bacterium]
MEIYDKRKKGYIEVWLTKEEQEMYDRSELTRLLLKDVKEKNCMVMFFLSGKEELYNNTEGLLLKNLGCA